MNIALAGIYIQYFTEAARSGKQSTINIFQNNMSFFLHLLLWFCNDGVINNLQVSINLCVVFSIYPNVKTWRKVRLFLNVPWSYIDDIVSIFQIDLKHFPNVVTKTLAAKDWQSFIKFTLLYNDVIISRLQVSLKLFGVFYKYCCINLIGITTISKTYVDVQGENHPYLSNQSKP